MGYQTIKKGCPQIRTRDRSVTASCDFYSLHEIWPFIFVVIFLLFMLQTFNSSPRSLFLSSPVLNYRTSRNRISLP